MKKDNIVVVGLGEVGKPLREIISRHHNVEGVDIAPPSTVMKDVDVLHICIPFQIRDFVGECARYIQMYSPKLTVINSTVAVGSTRAVAKRAAAPVVYSPVRGKHARMVQEMLHYTKFVGGLDRASAELAARHFESVGMKTKTLSSPEATEVAKLTETTFFGLMIAWAQEVERYADQLGQNYDEITSFYDEIGFFPPVKYTPGVIGGHCVMPNIDLLLGMNNSQILSAVKSSNEAKKAREANLLKTVEVAK